MDAAFAQLRGRSANTGELRQVFIRRVHQLIKLGYDRMAPKDFQLEEEPAITGELVRRIDEVCDDPRSNDWVTSFSVHDDPPVHSPTRKGKQRCRVDVRLDSSDCRPRQRFSFEAKRLDATHSGKKYLGRDGLGCFLWGDYASEEDTAGMLGYVQSGNPQLWAKKIDALLAKSPQSYAVMTECRWEQQTLPAGCEHTYRSRHMRKKPDRPIDVHHILLAFF